ncbi:MFS transporter, partial [Mycolicibacter minnesotensis]|uniref:MFS transporter n=1 Tax=Mycolicibacter minnesotensis TaxID=1118379 RepID=UPI0021F3BF25
MRPWIVWTTGLLAYIVAVLDRTTLLVAHQRCNRLTRLEDGHQTATRGEEVIVYAGAQVPAGLLLDRFGSKALIVAGATLMASGQLVLAFTESLPTAIGARAVVGLGDAFTFI